MRIALYEIVAVGLDAVALQSLAKGDSGRLPVVVGDDNRTDHKAAVLKLATQTQYILVVGYAEVGTLLVLLDVGGTNHDNYLYAIAYLLKHAQLAVRHKARKHTAGVVVVEKLASKFETFPVWNLPLKHPVNIAYEAATADLNDVNMIDPFHLEAYNKIAINYNRDIEIFPVLNALFEGIYGSNPYKSPTDMGVNMVGFCISDDEACCEASKNEIVRRYYAATNKLACGACNESEISKIQMLFNQAKITTDFRRCTVAAKNFKKETGHTSSAIELEDGTIITAKSSELLGCSAALLLNVMKHLAGIDHNIKLIPQSMIEPIQHTKISYLGGRNPRLHTDEVLVALSVLSEKDDNCRRALEQLPKLRGCQVHCTVILSDVDQKIFKKLGVDITCEPVLKR